MVFYPFRSSSSSRNQYANLAHTLNDLEQQVDNSTSPYTKKEIKQFKKYESPDEDGMIVAPAFESVGRIDPVKSGFMARKVDRDGGMKCGVGTLVKDRLAEQERRMFPSRAKTAAEKEEEGKKEEIGSFCTPQKKENGGGAALLFGSGSGSGVGISPATTTNTAGVNDSFGTVSTVDSSCNGSPNSSDIKKSNNTIQEEENNKEEVSIWGDLFASVLEVGMMDMCTTTNTAGVNDSFVTVSTMDSSCRGDVFRSVLEVGMMDMCRISPATTTNTAGVDDSFVTVSTMDSSCNGSPHSDIKKFNISQEEENNKEEEMRGIQNVEVVYGDDDGKEKMRGIQNAEDVYGDDDDKKKMSGIQNVEVVYGDDDGIQNVEVVYRREITANEAAAVSILARQTQSVCQGSSESSAPATTAAAASAILTPRVDTSRSHADEAALVSKEKTVTKKTSSLVEIKNATDLHRVDLMDGLESSLDRTSNSVMNAFHMLSNSPNTKRQKTGKSIQERINLTLQEIKELKQLDDPEFEHELKEAKDQLRRLYKERKSLDDKEKER